MKGTTTFSWIPPVNSLTDLTDELREVKLQETAERIYGESEGRWGSPSGVPIPSYDEMLMSKRKGRLMYE